MGKLWQKHYTLNSLIERFTVGEDYLLDRKLVPADCFGSLGHASMLHGRGLISREDYEAVTRGLVRIVELARKGEFPISPSDEDCHTAIENYLTENYGEPGKRIHTGRSRNDQVMTALRLFIKDFLHVFMKEVLDLSENLFDFADRYSAVPMPGRTHMQSGMPSSVGLWAASIGEALLDDLVLVDAAYRLNDRSPLGSAASYGVPLPVDREAAAEKLGFESIQNNVLSVANSRGKAEAAVLDALDQSTLTLSKAAQDLILFSLPEFGYFTLPDELCSGSSIMPQKKNPDVLELIRAKAAVLGGYASTVKATVRNLPSGYNRDFQETKGPLMRGTDLALLCVEVMDLTFSNLGVNEDRLDAGFTPDIFATDYALELVREGRNFRDAYRAVAADLKSLEGRDPKEAIRRRTATGTPGNLNLESGRNRAAALRDDLDRRVERFKGVKKELFGFSFPLY
jgi:argininosuccinate lyase